MKRVTPKMFCTLLLLLLIHPTKQQELEIKPIRTLQTGQICIKPHEHSMVTVRYTAKCNGKLIQDVHPQHTFTLDKHEVIEGLEQIVKELCLDEKVQAKIPPNLAYGTYGHKDLNIPANATIDVEVELIG